MILTGSYPYNAGTVEFSSRVSNRCRCQIETVITVTENGKTDKSSCLTTYRDNIGETQREEATAIFFNWARFFTDQDNAIPADLARIVRKFCSYAQLKALGLSNN